MRLASERYPALLWYTNGRIEQVGVRFIGVPLLKAQEAHKQGEFAQTYADNEGMFRWITVHPWGDDEKGIPVKIRESKTEKGVWHVVGGAGGKLNYLKLTGIKSPEEYKKQAAEKKQVHKEAQKARRELEGERKKKLTPEEREAESAVKRKEKGRKEELAQHVEVQRREQIKDVADTLGWKPEEWQFDATRERLERAGASEERIAKLEQAHYNRVYGRVEDAIKATKRQVLIDADLRAAAGLNELPLSTTEDAVMGLTDLDPDHIDRGLGYKRDTKKMSDEQIVQALTTEDIGRLEQDVGIAMSGNGDHPATTEEVAYLQGELNMARQIKATMGSTPEERTAKVEAIGKQIDEVKTAMDGYAPELRKLQGETEVTPKREALQIQFDQDRAKLDGLVQQQDAWAQTAGTVVKAEHKAMMAEQRQKRETELRQKGGEEAVEQFHERTQRMQQAIQRYRDEIAAYRAAGALTKPDLPTAAIQDPQKVIEMLKRAKAIQGLQRQAAEAAKEGGTVDERLFSKGYWVETRNAAKQDDLKRELTDMLSQQTTATFLREVESSYEDELVEMAESEKRENLQRHLSAGSFNALNHAALVVQGAPVLSRDAVDVLGPAGAAQVLAWGIRQGREAGDVRAIQEGLADYHLKHHMEASEEAVRTSRDLLGQAKEIELDASKSPADLQRQQEVNAKRRDYLLQAREMLGQTLGELESTAALEFALSEHGRKDVHVTLGPIGSETAIRQCRALGLGREDYTLDSDGTNRFLTVHESGFQKLLGKVDPEEIKLADEVAAIKRGDRDEEGWLPPGTVSRPATSFTDPGLMAKPVAPHQQLQHPMSEWGESATAAGANVVTDIEDHIGARIADGEDPNDMLPDLLSRVNEVPEKNRPAVMKWIQENMPLSVPSVSEETGKPIYKFDRETGEVVKGPDGKPIQAMRPVMADHYRPALQKLAERYMREHYGEGPKYAAFHAQGLRMGSPEETQRTSEAMYRALVEDPRRMVAFKDPGEMTSQDQAALRQYCLTEVSPGKASGKQIEALGKEPTKMGGPGLFGGKEEVTPEWAEWNKRRNAILSEDGDNGSVWEEYVASHSGNVTSAYQSLQDRLKHDFVKRFATTYAQQHGEPLKLGKQGIRYAERHMGFIDPTQREAMIAEKRRLVDTLRTRARGKYATGTMAERVDGALREEQILRQNQIGMFGSVGEAEKAEMGAGERMALGERAEAQIKSLMDNVGRSFRGHTDQPLKLIQDFSMSGQGTIGGQKVDLVKQQRAVKSFLARKRIGAYLGTGSGKTPVMLGAFTAAASDPKTGVKRGLFLVPAHLVGQMHGEIGQFVDPQKFKWSAHPGTSFEERMADHKDSATNMVVTTHEGFRDDMVKLLGNQWSMDAAAATAKFEGLSRKDRAAAIGEAFKANGVDYQAMFVDEGHKAKKRRGQEESLLSKVFMAATDNAKYMMNATADPLVNDVSEIRDQLDRLEPDGRYGDQEDWHKRYGLNTTASAAALQHEVAPRFLMSSVAPNVKVNRVEEKVTLSPEQQKAYTGVMKQYDVARVGRSKGTINVEAIKTLSPESFVNAPEAEHENIARRLSSSLGLLREAALRRVVNTDMDHNAKMETLEKRLAAHPDRPTVIFSHNPSVVREISERLKKQGRSVAMLTGSESQKEKNAARLEFQGGGGKAPTADVIVMSDAGETGLNLQRGATLIQYDTPVTPKSHAQRQARIYRLGQKQDVDLIDLVSDTPFEQRARQLLTKKYERRAIFSGETPDGGDELETAIQKRRAQTMAGAESKAVRLAENEV